MQLPGAIARMFDDELVLTGERKRLYVTLGQFSIIRLERDAQLIVPVLDYAIPTKECCEAPGCAETNIVPGDSHVGPPDLLVMT